MTETAPTSIEIEKISYRLLIISTFLALGFFYFDLLVPLGIAGGIPYTALVALSVYSPRINFTLYVTSISSILIVLGHILSPEGGEQWMAITNRFLALSAIWVTSILLIFWKQAEEERRKIQIELDGSQEDVKILSGLLPICASCKKIRDDEGPWNQVEEYIHEHSEAQFSHGICPDCRKKLYPEFAD